MISSEKIIDDGRRRSHHSIMRDLESISNLEIPTSLRKAILKLMIDHPNKGYDRKTIKRLLERQYKTAISINSDAIRSTLSSLESHMFIKRIGSGYYRITKYAMKEFSKCQNSENYFEENKSIELTKEKELNSFIKENIGKMIEFRYKTERAKSDKWWRRVKVYDQDDEYLYTTESYHSGRRIRYLKEKIVEYRKVDTANSTKDEYFEKINTTIDSKINNIGISEETVNNLNKHGIKTVQELLVKRDLNLLSDVDLSEKDYERLFQKLKEMDEYYDISDNDFADDGLKDDDCQELVDKTIGVLWREKCKSERDFKILVDYYNNAETLQVLGERYGLSRERVRQIIARDTGKILKMCEKECICDSIFPIINNAVKEKIDLETLEIHDGYFSTVGIVRLFSVMYPEKYNVYRTRALGNKTFVEDGRGTLRKRVKGGINKYYDDNQKEPIRSSRSLLEEANFHFFLKEHINQMIEFRYCDTQFISSEQWRRVLVTGQNDLLFFAKVTSGKNVTYSKAKVLAYRELRRNRKKQNNKRITVALEDEQ